MVDFRTFEAVTSPEPSVAVQLIPEVPLERGCYRMVIRNLGDQTVFIGARGYGPFSWPIDPDEELELEELVTVPDLAVKGSGRTPCTVVGYWQQVSREPLWVATPGSHVTVLGEEP